MPRFCANLTTLFVDVPFLQRFARAAQAGFTAVEFQFPYAWPAQAIAAQLQTHGLEAVLHNLPAGDWAAGERGMACHPGREGEFRAAVAQAMDYALTLGVGQLNCIVGLRPPGDEAKIRRTLVANLQYAAQALAGAGLRLLIEPLNGYDVPGFYLQRTAQALDILEAVHAPNAFLQYDLYHAHRNGEDVMPTLGQHMARIGHIQLADHPGRHEPGTGSTPFDTLLPAIDRLGYGGFIGCEYHPLGQTEAGLGWLQAYGFPAHNPPR